MSIPKMAKAMNNIDDDLISGAIEYKRTKKKNGWMKWGAMAACLCLMVTLVIPMLNNDAQSGSHGGEIMIDTKKIDVYYISENGTLASKNIEVTCTAEDVFSEWSKLNGIADVTLVDCVYDNGAVENVKGDANDPEAPVEHFGTDHYTLTITLSKKFSKYSEGVNGDKLVESLEKTFAAYNHFDEFILEIAD